MLKKLLSFFRRKDPKVNVEKKDDWTDENSQFQEDFRQRQARLPIHLQDDESDYLGMAATAKHEAVDALERSQFDLAWKLEHERIQHYTNHALREGFTSEESFGLLSIVYSSLSNILRVEGKHTLGLAFYLYSVQCDGTINEGTQANIRRICRVGKLKHFESNINDFLINHVSESSVCKADLKFCQSEVNRWVSEAPFHSEDIQEMIKHYKSTPGYLSLINGVTKNIEKSLQEAGVDTIESLISIEAEELLKLKGIGKASLLKINNATEFL
tara:strand:- start:972 stop:1784 length:813 start_codon:yes stop_codon:yes gene_type:complete